MLSRHIASVIVVLTAFGPSGARATDPAPIGSGPFADGKVIQAVGNGTVASRILQRTSLETNTDQIRFDIQIVNVDPETRDQIYQALGSDAINTTISKIGESQMSPDPATSSSTRSSRRTMETGSIVSTAVMDREQTRMISELLQNEACNVVARPTIIAADGQVAAIEQKVQRPFLTDLQKVTQGQQSAVQSAIQVFNEGLEFAIEASSNGSGLDIHGKLEQARVAKVDQHKVYGLGENHSVVQVPSHEIRTASARERLTPAQTLLLDPYFETTRLVTESENVAMLEGVPYVGEMFESTTTKEVKSNMMILLTARKLPPRTDTESK